MDDKEVGGLKPRAKAATRKRIATGKNVKMQKKKKTQKKVENDIVEKTIKNKNK